MAFVPLLTVSFHGFSEHDNESSLEARENQNLRFAGRYRLRLADIVR